MTDTSAQRTSAQLDLPPPAATVPLVLLVGNPNTGKTTLFNRLTGQNARVGNYPGITVERRHGTITLDGRLVELADVPGSYSLSARSAEEQIAINSVLGIGENPKPSLVVAVVDAGQLIRNLYLVLQLAELRVPLLIVLNMIDETRDNPPSTEAISALFGVPCVATNARRGKGLEELSARMGEALAAPPRPRISLRYPEALRPDIDRTAEALPQTWRSSVERDRALALWALTSVEPDDELVDVPDALREKCLEVQRAAGERDIDREVIATRYAFLDEHHTELSAQPEAHPKKRAGSERVDRVLLHPVFGFVLFVALMLVVFQALFSWSDPAISLVEDAFGWLGGRLGDLLPAGIARDFVVEGLIGGVGNVIVFLPQILLLFLFIGLLEDSGYMARVAFLMDRIMRVLGLHGRAFVPMLSGLACAVPAILATRTMERKRDRLLTMLVVPLMTCSARLPIYTLVIAALFPPTDVFGALPLQGLMMVGMYLFSVVITLIAAGVLGRTVVKGKQVPLILELPPYRVPSLRSVLRMMWERSSLFLKEAGTVILACTVLLWVLLSFPKPDIAPQNTTSPPVSAEVERARQLENSYAGRVGKAIEPVLAPLGFDWKIGVGIIGAFAAREVFISTMGIVYGVGEVGDDTTSLRDRMRAELREDGRPVYTPVVGLSLMVFFALACQCMSTLAVVRRETKSWRWPAFLFAYMTGLAYVASLLVYQIGSRLT